MDYKEKIENILTNVATTEKKQVVVTPEVKTNPLHDKIKTDGVKKTIISLFTESVGDYTLNEEKDEESKRIPNTQFFKVSVPSNFPDADRYWESLIPRIRSLGKTSISPSGSADIVIGNTGNGKENLRVQLVRDEGAGDKPGLFLSWTDAAKMEVDEASQILKKSGLGVENETPVEKGVVIHAVP